MSIVMNRHLEYEELLDCIKMAIPHIKTFLEYPDKTKLADSNDNQTILIYSEDSFMQTASCQHCQYIRLVNMAIMRKI